MQQFDEENYILQTPVSVYGYFFPQGTEYRHVNADWWYPITSDGAILPAYQVHFTVIRNNTVYFKLKSNPSS